MQRREAAKGWKPLYAAQAGIDGNGLQEWPTNRVGRAAGAAS